VGAAVDDENAYFGIAFFRQPSQLGDHGAVRAVDPVERAEAGHERGR
jgi:hypothetical protein